jgi:deoxycytidylate deaminase
MMCKHVTSHQHEHKHKVTPYEDAIAANESYIKHAQYIKLAASLALKSDLIHHRHGCVIVSNKGKIVAEGYNYRLNTLSIHAEIDALTKIKGNAKKMISTYTMYIVRIGTDNMGNPLKYSRPCNSCTDAILKSGIKKVFYSTNYFDYLVCNQMLKINE